MENRARCAPAAAGLRRPVRPNPRNRPRTGAGCARHVSGGEPPGRAVPRMPGVPRRPAVSRIPGVFPGPGAAASASRPARRRCGCRGSGGRTGPSRGSAARRSPPPSLPWNAPSQRPDPLLPDPTVPPVVPENVDRPSVSAAASSVIRQPASLRPAASRNPPISPPISPASRAPKKCAVRTASAVNAPDDAETTRPPETSSVAQTPAAAPR